MYLACNKVGQQQQQQRDPIFKALPSSSLDTVGRVAKLNAALCLVTIITQAPEGESNTKLPNLQLDTVPLLRQPYTVLFS